MDKLFFIIDLTYIKPLEHVNKYLEAHRAYLNSCYQKNIFLMSGPKEPRTGGIILARGNGIEEIENIVKQDPFYINKLIIHTITEFQPTKSVFELC